MPIELQIHVIVLDTVIVKNTQLATRVLVLYWNQVPTIIFLFACMGKTPCMQYIALIICNADFACHTYVTEGFSPQGKQPPCAGHVCVASHCETSE